MSKINYWRAKDNAEVDFIANKGAIKEMFVVNKTFSAEEKINDTWV